MQTHPTSARPERLRELIVEGTYCMKDPDKHRGHSKPITVPGLL